MGDTGCLFLVTWSPPVAEHLHVSIHEWYGWVYTCTHTLMYGHTRHHIDVSTCSHACTCVRLHACACVELYVHIWAQYMCKYACLTRGVMYISTPPSWLTSIIHVIWWWVYVTWAIWGACMHGAHVDAHPSTIRDIRAWWYGNVHVSENRRVDAQKGFALLAGGCPPRPPHNCCTGC